MAKKFKPLQVTEVKSLVVDYNDFDRLVKEVYGKYFSFIDDQESGNDSSHEFTASRRKLDKYTKQKIEEFIEDGEYCFITDDLLQDLCIKKIISPGHYVIRVCW